MFSEARTRLEASIFKAANELNADGLWFKESATEITLCLSRRGHQMIWVDEKNEIGKQGLLRAMGSAAADPNTEFYWYDAAIVTRLVRELFDRSRKQARKAA